MTQEQESTSWQKVENTVGDVLDVFGALFGNNNGSTAPAPAPAPETNYTPWIIGGAVFLAVIIMVVTLTKK